MTQTPFDRLIEQLTEEQYPTWTLYDPRTDPFRVQVGIAHRRGDAERAERGWAPSEALSEPFCRDAWVICEDAHDWYIFRGWREEREELRFASEEDACAALHRLVVAEHARGIRALTADEVPLSVRRLRSVVSADPPEARRGEVLVAGDGSMAYRLTEDSRGFALSHPSIHPPAVGEVLVRTERLDDALRVLIARMGQRIRRVPGVPRWGLPSPLRQSHEFDLVLARWAHLSIDQIVEGYLGAPEGVLEQLGAPEALHLLTDGLLARGLARGWSLATGGGPNWVRLTQHGERDLVLGQDADDFVLRERGERQNNDREIGRYESLNAARSALADLIG